VVEVKKEHFSSKLGFLFSAIGSAVGLGVLWKFPFTVGNNGGGLFILSYILCVLLIGLPIFIGEILLGRKTQKGAVLAFGVLSEKKGWRIGGMLGVIASFFIMSFYSVIAGWGLSYILMMLCDFSKGQTAEGISNIYIELSRSGGITMLWHGIFTLITMVIVFSGVKDGIEYWSKIMMRFLFIILALLVIYNTSLSGFSKALDYLIFGQKGSFKASSVLEALGLAFFTLSLGQGIMISYGGYTRRGDNIPLMCSAVSFGVILVASLSSLLIFPVIFTYGFDPSMGTGLVFQTLPFLFAKLPAGKVIGVAFFSLFVFAAVTSAIAFVEVVAVNIMDHYKIERKKAVSLVCLMTFIVGIPAAFSAAGGVFSSWSDLYGRAYLETVDEIVSVWIIPLSGLFTSLFIGWVVPKSLWKEEFLSGSKAKAIFPIWYFFIKFLAPLLIILIILQKSELINFNKIFLLS
jgi:NSS family neurotransmitter:Na+ symporter